MTQSYLSKAHEELSKILGPELGQIIDNISQAPGDGNTVLPDLPSAYDTDKDISALLDMVARTSNTYYRMARLAGMAKAEQALAERRYKDTFKSNLIGKNEAERTKAATEAASEAHTELATAEAIRALADSLEGSARVASESARKILDKVQSMTIASFREERGTASSSSYRSF